MSEPSRASLVTTSDGTAQSSQSHLRNDEDDPQDALERIFTPEIFDKLMWVEGQPHQSVFAEAFRFVLEQTRKEHGSDAAPSTTNALLRHYGIMQTGFGSDLVHRLGNLVRTPSPPLDHLRNVESLARVYCEENPDGGCGYSFGALLDRYLFFHLVYFYRHQIGDEASFIGGEGRRYIDGGNHETNENQRVGRTSGTPDANVTLHWVRGDYLVRPGAGRAYERVTTSLPDLLGHELDPNFLYLCHGTTIAHASAIVREGPDIVGAVCTDFGQAFYLTDSFEYAVFAGLMVSGGRTDVDTAVLVFPIPLAALNEGRTLNLTGDTWKQVVVKCRRGRRVENVSLRREYDGADCVTGPISFNASKVDTGKQEAWPMEGYQQWAFKRTTFIDEIFLETINNGTVHVFRIVHESEEEERFGGAVGEDVTMAEGPEIAPLAD